MTRLPALPLLKKKVLLGLAWVEIKSSAVEVDRRLEVLDVAEPAGHAFDLFDQAVVALGAGVGQPGVQERQDRWPPRLDRAREPGNLGNVGVSTPSVEAVESAADLAVVSPVSCSGK